MQSSEESIASGQPSPTICRKSRAKIISSGLWSVLEVGVNLVFGTAIVFVLAHLIGPTEYGTAAIAMSVVGLVQIIVTEGLAAALIRRPSLTDCELSSFFWANVLIGVGLGTTIWLGAPLAAAAFDAAGVSGVLRALSVLPVLQAIAAIPAAKLMRELNFRPLAAAPMVACLVAGAVGLGLGFAGYGVWALVAYYLLTAAARAAIVLVAARWVPKLRLRTGIIAENARFSLLVIATRAEAVANGRLSVLIAGLVLGPEAAGLWRLAQQLNDALVSLTIVPVHQIALPAFARAKGNREEIRGLYLKMTGAVASIAVPCALGAILLMPEFVAVFLGAQWEASAGVAQIFLASMVSISLLFLVPNALLSIDRPQEAWHYALGHLVLNQALLLAAAPFGLFAAAIAYTARLYLILPYGFRFLRTHFRMPLRRWLGCVAPALSASALMMVIVWALDRHLVGVLDSGQLLAFSIVAGAASYVLLLRVFWPRVIGDLCRLARPELVARLSAMPVLGRLIVVS